MKSVGTYDGDSMEHVKMPYAISTLCGRGIAMVDAMNDFGYYKSVFPEPTEYAIACPQCQAMVHKLEDFLIRPGD